MKLFLLLSGALEAQAFWRMNCGTIQTGRVDPIINPGAVSGHVHMISGASNINTSSTFNSLRQSFCTSCQIQDDKSAYWTPLLYYQRKNGSFVPVRNDGTVVYYLGRGDDRANIIPFPAGLQMVSGDPFVRYYDNTTLTYQNGRPIADRVSFNCLQGSYAPLPETNSMSNTNCPNGLRAQIQFQSCWDGVNLYKSDQSHVAYMSQIDNGVCPPTHPKLLPHLFYEIYYWPNEIDSSDGGKFVFANGDPTGYGFHGDFLNGWNLTTLQAGIAQCINTVDSGLISDCPPLYASNDNYYGQNCPERPPIVNEQVKGVLSSLPGCNVPTPGPGRASPACNKTAPSLNAVVNDDGLTREIPAINKTRNGMTYMGCFIDNTSGRALTGASYADDGMSLEFCASFCRGKGFSVFGTEYARECYCGNTISSSKTNQSDCAMACSGNETEYCGSGNRLSVWSLSNSLTSASSSTTTSSAGPRSTTVSSVAPSSTSGPALADATYLGCYSDSTSNRAITPGTSNAQNMNLEICQSTAQSNNHKYFGLEYAGECYTGNSIASSPIASSGCNMPCNGNKTEMCGGPNALSVFQNNKYTQTTNSAISGFTYQGCYTDNVSGRALPIYSFTNSSMTVNMCTSACASKGYAFAGTEYSTECYCGNGVTNGGTITSDADCNVACGGNRTQYCGGPNRLTVYKANNGDKML